MASSSKTSTADDVQRQIEHMKNHSVSFGGKQGYFVSKDKLKSIESKLLHAMEKDDEESPTRLLNLQDELDEIKKSSEFLQNELKAAQQKVRERGDLIVKLQREKETQELLAKSRLDEVNKTHKQYKEILEQTKEERLKVQEELRSAAKGFDPEKAKDLQMQVENLTGKIRETTKQLELINSDKKTLEKELYEYKGKILAAQAEKDELTRQVDSLINARKRASIEEIPPLTVPRPEINNRLVARILGEKGLDFLHQAEQAMVDDYRDRVYKLMWASRHGKTQNLKSLSALLEIVFHWLRQKTYKARAVVAKWVDLIEAHLRKGTIKAVSWYRDRLRELVDDFEEIKASYGHEPGKPERWHKHAYYWLQVVWNRAKRQPSKIARVLKRAKAKLDELYLRFRSYLGFAKRQDPDLYSPEDLAIDEKGKRPAYNGVPPPPVPIRGPSKVPGKLGDSKAKLAALFGAK
ncbi:gp2 [Macrophomina phaseolina single-stranded RNA virus 1]|uniref:Gp2 n=1 Tax=Macrophomina phaseolina single-stranded RNA virus 1 TaxID=1708488 RepID=A0AAC9EWV4_9VIRU|nr:gp2 [Macrophomina phaseolina single-stranded RNA virus 1]ALD89095.1 gp2 [Macrophomina phaseolina single-stranded RNA virus 1]